MRVPHVLQRLIELRPPRLTRAAHVLTAPLVTALALALELVVLPRPAEAPFVLFYCGVALAAWLSGRAVGIATAFLSSLTVAFFIVGFPRTWTIDSAEFAAIGAFFMSGSVVALLCGSLNRALAESQRVARVHAQREARYKALFEHAPVPFCECDLSEVARRLARLRASGVADIAAHLSSNPEELSHVLAAVRVVEVSRVAAEGFGLASAADAQAWLQTAPSEVREPVIRAVVALDRGETSFSAELTVGESGAPARVIDVTLGVLPGSGKDWSRVILGLVDRTERVRAGQALRESENRYRSLFDNTISGLAYCRMVYEGGRPVDFVYLTVNEAFSRLTGLTGVVGKPVSEIVRGIRESDPELFEIYGRVATTAVPERFEMHVQALQQWFSVSVYSPHPEHFVAVFDVITERKLAEIALKASEERLQLAVRESPFPMMIHAEDGCVLQTSRSWSELTGYSADDLSSIERWTELAYGQRAEEARRSIRCLYDLDAPVHEGRAAIRAADGSTRNWELRASPLGRLSDGRRLVLSMAVDVTDRLQAEREREALEAQLQQAQKMEAVGRLAGGVAHDFNNLLTGIIGSVSLARTDTAENSRLGHVLDDIDGAANSAARLTRQLLAFSRKQIIQPRVLDLNRLIGDVEKMLSRLIGEDVALCTVLDPELPHVRVDPGQLEQVLVNLAVNARDAMPHGGMLTLRTSTTAGDVERLERLGPGTLVRLRISDTGTGMSNDVMAHCFEPFFSTKPKDRGTGLGLATVYGIVNQSGGLIDVSSELGVGTTFDVYLPAVDEPVRAISRAPQTVQAAPGNETIFVVEDDPMVRRVATRGLKRLGYDVHAFGDPREAVLAAQKYPGAIHLLLSDVVMPQMNGRALAAELGAIRPGLSVVFTSGYTEDVIVQHGVLDSGLDFIAKPYTLEALASKIRAVLDRTAFGETHRVS